MIMDMRIPVVTGGVPGVGHGDVALVVAEETPNHATGCDCCVARNAAGTALGRLFLARARGEAPWFTRVVAICETAGAEASLRVAEAQCALHVHRIEPAAEF